MVFGIFFVVQREGKIHDIATLMRNVQRQFSADLPLLLYWPYTYAGQEGILFAPEGDWEPVAEFEFPPGDSVWMRMDEKIDHHLAYRIKYRFLTGAVRRLRAA